MEKLCDYIEICKEGFEWDFADDVCACVPKKCNIECQPWEMKQPDCTCKSMEKLCDYIKICDEGYQWDSSDDVCACVPKKSEN